MSNKKGWFITGATKLGRPLVTIANEEQPAHRFIVGADAIGLDELQPAGVEG